MQKKLYKIEEGKMLCGVCGGLGEYFGVDPTIVRLLWAAVSLCGPGLLAYIIAAIIVPRKSDVV